MQKEKVGDLGPAVSWSEDPRSEAMLEHHRKGEFNRFKRSEEEILNEAKRLLNEHPEIDAKDVSVRVENHCVVLEGTVGTKREKELSKFLMENLSGVCGVFNYLHLKV